MTTIQHHSLPRLTLALSAATLALTSPLFPPAAFAQASIDVMGRRHVTHREMAPVVVEDAINIIGVDGMKPGSKGRLEIGAEGLTLANDKSNSIIPADAISFFAMDHSTKALMRGATGVLASLAPNGAGQIYSAIRPGAETLTIFYRDEDDALHGAVILLPKSSKEAVIRAFADLDLQPGDSARLEEMYADPAPQVPAARSQDRRRSARRAVTIALPKANGLMPPSFTAATYEAMIVEVNKGGIFSDVWRQGDSRADDNALNLTLDITSYKKGNAGVRGAIPVVGMIAGKTLIQADLRLENTTGEVLFEKDVEGSKRMMGESIGASTSLAQRVSKALVKESRLSGGAWSNREVAMRQYAPR